MRLRVFFTLMTALSASGSVSAQQQPGGGGEFAPPPDDPSLGILREIFGNLVDFVAGGDNAAELASNGTVMAAGFEIFNVAVLFLGMLFVGYMSIMGVINTAHDGEFLGKKMSSIWVPLRTVGGSALLLPVAGGFSAIQILVMWLAVQGVGIGDKVWTAMLTRVDQGGMVGHPHIPDARPLAANIFKFEVCRAAMNKHYADAGRSERIVVEAKTDYIRSLVPTDSALSFGPGALTGTGYVSVRIPVQNFYWKATGGYVNPNVCGSLEWEESPQSQEGNARYLDLGGIAQVHGQAVNSMITALRPVAEKIVAGEKPGGGAIAQAAYTYESQLQSAARAAVESSNQSSKDAFVDFAKTGGWLHAGAYYNHIIQLNDAVQLAVNSMPVSDSISIDQNQETDAALVGYRDAMAVADEYLKQRADATHQAFEEERIRDQQCAWRTMTSFEAIKKCLSKPALWGIEQMTQEMAGSNTSHVAQVKGVGDTIMAAGWTLFGTYVLGNSIAKGVSDSLLGEVGGGVVHGLVEPMGGLITMMVLALLGFGAVASFYIPMIPFIGWISGVIKWVVSVTEALIAAPIFAAAHIHPDGDDAVGRAGPGYMLILSMVLRPVLMLFGLLAAIAVAQPIAHLVNGTFIFAVKGAMHDSANGLGAFIAYSAIYMIIMTTLLHAVFALINYIPDQTLRWMGSAVGMHGVADSEGKESEHVFVGASRQHAPGAVTSAKGDGRSGGSRPGGNGGGGATTDADHSQVPHGGGGNNRGGGGSD